MPKAPESQSKKSSGPSAGELKRLVLIDAANCFYRAFFAIPPLRTADGFPTNAAYGFVNMLNKVLRDENPDAVAVVFDSRGKTFRHSIYPEYKATRDAQPEDLSVQLPVVRELVEAYGLPILELAEYEADDLIATLVTRAPELEVVIISTDKDLMQLVSDRVNLLDTMRDRRFGPEEVEARFGVKPDRVLDVRALTGDSSDNIPGVKGIGDKGAAKLIGEWGDLENLLAHASEVKAKRAREALLEQAEQARLSKRLATLETDAPVDVELESLRRREPDEEALRRLFQRYEFTRLLEALGGAAAPEASTVAVECITSDAALAKLVKQIGAAERVALQAVGCAPGAMCDEPVGLALAVDTDQAWYVPLGVAQGAKLSFAAVCKALRPSLMGKRAVPWVGRDTKQLQSVLVRAGLEVATSAFDVEVAAFLRDPAAPRTSVALAQKLGRSLRSWEDMAGRGAKATPASELALEDVSRWAGEEVCALIALEPHLRQALERDGLASLFDEVEMPLTSVLGRMERAGVRVDEDVLAQLSIEYESELSRIEGEIYRLAGESFQVSSPKQLQRILFEKLKLPVVKKTKTGYSTDESVLEKLAAHHELPTQVLAYRRLAKLKSTYVDALPPLVNGETGRIHPIFHQTGAATGRLSAANPNVQNIPIRSAEGIRIREAFVPAEGKTLLSADYSQVELRIVAHFSEDEGLIQAFESGDDIHRRTASEVLGVPLDEVSDDQRARAKAINFGIIYGSSAFGIANQLGIATAEAQSTIDAYFNRYKGVRSFIKSTVEHAREEGFIRTLLGRRRYLPDLRSRNQVLRNAAERMAVNSVIQGTAADLIKQAMVSVDEALPESGLDAQMLLQVHDELVFEVSPGDADALEALARQHMEQVVALRVPLVVDAGRGANWRQAH